MSEEQQAALTLTRDLFSQWLDARRAREDSRGSMTWVSSKGRYYLVRSYYEANGVRKQLSHGPRSPATERMKVKFEVTRATAKRRFENADAALAAQAEANRTLGLANVPTRYANALRTIDARPEIRDIVRIVGATAVYGYQAQAGVRFDGFRGHSDPEILEIEVLGALTRRLVLSLQRVGCVIVAGHDAKKDVWSDVDRLWLQYAKNREAFVIDEDGYPIRMLTVEWQDWLPQRVSSVTDWEDRFTEEFEAAFRGEVLALWRELPIDLDF